MFKKLRLHPNPLLPDLSPHSWSHVHQPILHAEQPWLLSRLASNRIMLCQMHLARQIVCRDVHQRHQRMLHAKFEKLGYEQAWLLSSMASNPIMRYQMHLARQIVCGVPGGILERDQLCFGTPNANQARATGREGERAASRYFSAMYGEKSVRWINEIDETGLPYDIIIVKDNGKTSQYIEVKATKSVSKDWFYMSVAEVQFALWNPSYTIAYVVLSPNGAAKFRVFKNPAHLWLQKILRLAVLIPAA